MASLLEIKGLTLRRDDGTGSAIINVGHYVLEWPSGAILI